MRAIKLCDYFSWAVIILLTEEELWQKLLPEKHLLDIKLRAFNLWPCVNTFFVCDSLQESQSIRNLDLYNYLCFISTNQNVAQQLKFQDYNGYVLSLI